MALCAIGAGQIDPAVRLARNAGRIVTSLTQLAGRLGEQRTVRRLGGGMTGGRFTVGRGQMLNGFGLPDLEFLRMASLAETDGRAVDFRIGKDLSDGRALHLTGGAPKGSHLAAAR